MLRKFTLFWLYYRCIFSECISVPRRCRLLVIQPSFHRLRVRGSWSLSYPNIPICMTGPCGLLTPKSHVSGLSILIKTMNLRTRWICRAALSGKRVHLVMLRSVIAWWEKWRHFQRDVTAHFAFTQHVDLAHSAFTIVSLCFPCRFSPSFLPCRLSRSNSITSIRSFSSCCKRYNSTFWCQRLFPALVSVSSLVWNSV